jgi:hypothetical protein
LANELGIISVTGCALDEFDRLAVVLELAPSFVA